MFLQYLNISLIEMICEYLEIDTKRIRLSNLLNEYGEKHNLSSTYVSRQVLIGTFQEPAKERHTMMRNC